MYRAIMIPINILSTSDMTATIPNCRYHLFSERTRNCGFEPGYFVRNSTMQSTRIVAGIRYHQSSRVLENIPVCNGQKNDGVRCGMLHT